MKKYLLGLAFLSSAIFLSTPTLAAAQVYKLDPSHSFVVWQISHMGFSTQTGKWPANGTITLDQANLQNSKVDVVIKIADIVTGITKLNEHLESAGFFDAAKYPTAKFTSSKVDVTGKDTANVEGMLTVRGITKPVTLKVTLNKLGENPFTHQPAVGFGATAEIKRSDFGMTEYAPALGDDVKLNIQVEAAQDGK